MTPAPTHCALCCEPGHTMTECKHPIKDCRLDFQPVDDHRVRVRLVPVTEVGEIGVIEAAQEELNVETAGYLQAPCAVCLAGDHAARDCQHPIAVYYREQMAHFGLRHL